MNYADEHERTFFEKTLKNCLDIPNNDEELMILWQGFLVAKSTFEITDNFKIRDERLQRRVRKVIGIIKRRFKKYICYSYLKLKAKNVDKEFASWRQNMNDMYFKDKEKYTDKIKDTSIMFISIIDYYVINIAYLS